MTAGTSPAQTSSAGFAALNGEHRHVVCGTAELLPGTTREIKVGRRAIVVAHVPDHGYVALANQCPHQGAPLSRGVFEPMWVGDKAGEHARDMGRWVLVCPFHNFETDVRSGCPVASLGRRRNATYPVRAENGEVVVYL
jgi:nitrite reductase (NADH) small subunit